MLDPAYDSKKYENKIYKKWEKSGAFKAKVNPKKKPFTISMPPPNATGTLHLGHAVMLAIQDILTRHRRMKGYEALWLPGTDHAAIATQNKVEKIIAEEGLTRQQLGREPFLQRVREYVANSQSIIRNQVRKIGSSCDWSRERYTLDDDLSAAVTEIFVRMYEDGLIYRGYRIVNWCPRCKSTLADDEVAHEERVEKLYWIKYGPFMLATSRPETKLGDTAVAVHPKDKRYKKHVGKKYMIPGVLGEFEVIVVADEAVNIKFGSGVIKVTPAHDFTDFEIAQRHGVSMKKIIDENGRMMENCGKYAGLTTYECRDKIVEDMKKMGLIEKIEDNYTHNVGLCYRCSSVIEPIPSDQWFIDVNKKFKIKNLKLKINKTKASLKELANHVVKNTQIKIIPDRFEKSYFNWTENLRDWCISRQIWWGHRIPVWYCLPAGQAGIGDKECKPDCKKPIVSRETPKSCPACGSKKLRQDEDTLDTWFSSGLWTFSTLGWPKETADLKYFHPTSVLETGYDILTFWVIRMVIMTTYALGEVPFKTVYLHGLIRDKQGRKMSKQLGNGIDPIDMIKKYGADALRLSMVMGNTPGNDMRLYEEKIEGYRNFTNKLWNASRFVLGILENVKTQSLASQPLSDADEWILGRLSEITTKVDENLEQFHISEAGQTLYDFLWSDFCDWYLELSKGEKQNPAVLHHVLKNILILLHPFVPFVTEEIWSHLSRNQGMLINAAWPNPVGAKHAWPLQGDAHAAIQNIIGVISAIRRLRTENKIDPVKKIPAIIHAHTHLEALQRNQAEILRLARLSELTLAASGNKPKECAAEISNGIEIFIPLSGLVDMAQEKERLKKEITNLENYSAGLSKKLSNEAFVKNARKEIVEQEKARLKEAKERLKKLKGQLASMN